MQTQRAVTGSTNTYPPRDPPTRTTFSAAATSSWDCTHARNELMKSVGDVYIGFGTMAATSETGIGALVGAGITLAAFGDTIVKGDAADHACKTGRYASPP